MKKFLAVVLFCLPAFGQGAYSGRGLYSGAAAYGAGPSCGPPNYSCFSSSTSVVNLTIPIPSWGPNTCDSTSMDTLQTCGNLTGAGYSVTPADFGNTMVRVTDVNTPRCCGAPLPGHYMTTDDAANPTNWNVDDTAFVAKLIPTDVYEIMTFNPTTMAAAMTNPPLSLPIGAGVSWSHSVNNVIYTLGSTPTQLYKYTVNFTPGSASLTPTLLYDFNNSKCLTNSLNGYTGGSFVASGEGTFASTANDTVFPMAFATGGGGQDSTSAKWIASWNTSDASGGCDVYNVATGTVTHDGAWVSTPTANGVVVDQWGGAAYGGIPELFYWHSNSGTPPGTYITITGNLFTQGAGTGAPFLWQVGTDSVVLCGVGANSWIANHPYNTLGYHLQPNGGNAGNFIYQIIASGNEGTSGPSAPTWNQTPGSDVTETGGSGGPNGTGPRWRNIGVGTASENDCTGHGWSGYTGLALGNWGSFHYYSNPTAPLTKQYSLSNPSIQADSHFGSANDNPNDTAWIFGVTGKVGTTANLLGTLPSVGYDEIFFFSPVNIFPGVPNFVGTGGTLGQIRRAAHTYNTGWSWVFDIQNAISEISQTGTFALVSTDGMGQFGNIDGTHGSCNIGGPDWNSSDSADYVVGQKVLPQSGNAGHYIYKIQSCSGTCTTGSSAPTWVQSSIVAGVGTFSDGTITWQGAPDVLNSANTAVQNCRADLIVVKLTR